MHGGTVEPLITDSLISGPLCYYIADNMLCTNCFYYLTIVYLQPRIADTSKLQTTDNSTVQELTSYKRQRVWL